LSVEEKRRSCGWRKKVAQRSKLESPRIRKERYRERGCEKWRGGEGDDDLGRKGGRDDLRRRLDV